MSMTHERLDEYISGFVPSRSSVLSALEQLAAERGIPNIQLASIQLIKILLRMNHSRNILEIGTAVGYSAIHMAEAAPEARITTIELDAERADLAREHFWIAGVNERVQLIEGDALEVIPAQEGSFDFIFVDAAKGKYREFVELSLPKLPVGGIIVTDNVLFRGRVAMEGSDIHRRHRSMVQKLKDFNRWLAEHPGLDTSFVPIGDGLAISVRKSFEGGNAQ
jgi:predicted O-methyltransferase YrrM